MRTVRITLAAFTRVEYSTVVEVPEETTPEELDALVEQTYEQTDGGEFTHDPYYWERATCEWSEESKDKR